MKNLFGLALIPLLCMGVTILTALVIIFALRRGTKAINEQAEQVITEKQSTQSANTRWARADLKSESNDRVSPPPMHTCPGCGGENPVNSGTCAYCGRKL